MSKAVQSGRKTRRPIVSLSGKIKKTAGATFVSRMPYKIASELNAPVFQVIEILLKHGSDTLPWNYHYETRLAHSPIPLAI